MRVFKRIVGILLAITLVGSLFAGCVNKSADDGEGTTGEAYVERKKAKVGDKVVFGRYGKEGEKKDIVWLVLKKEGRKLLLISEGVVDVAPYNKTRSSVTWETCELRTWLNGEFLDTAFEAKEKNKIVESKVSTPDNADHKTPGGNDTDDKVFILSIEEAKELFEEDMDRRAKATDYAKEKGLKASTEQLYLGNSPWWLRSPGRSGTDSSYVNVDGRIYNSIPVDNAVPGIRPVIWVKA